MRRVPYVLFAAGLVALIGVATSSRAKASILRQTNEMDGFREPEYGLFGVTLYQPQIKDASLKVSGDFRAELAKAGLKSPPQVEAQADKAVRTIRRGGTQYWLRTDLQADAKALAKAYSAQMTSVWNSTSTSGTQHIEGICPDGKTSARIMIDPRGGKTVDFLLTFGPGS